MPKFLKIILLIILSLIAAFLIFWSTCTVVLMVPNKTGTEIGTDGLYFLVPALVLLIPTVIGINSLIKNIKKKD